MPQEVRQIGESFNTVLAYRDPMQQIVYQNYMKVRALLPLLKSWIDQRVNGVAAGRVANPEKTFVYYWLKNAGNGEHFSEKDIVFEVFHNFVALSQWGNTIFGIMSRLAEDSGDPKVRAAFSKTMTGATTTPTMHPIHRLNYLSWSYSARSRRTAVASRQSTMRGIPPTAPHRTSALACALSAAATSAPLTPRPASTPCIGRIPNSSTPTAIVM